jgi:hypothetical protein
LAAPAHFGYLGCLEDDGAVPTADAKTGWIIQREIGESVEVGIFDRLQRHGRNAVDKCLASIVSHLNSTAVADAVSQRSDDPPAVAPFFAIELAEPAISLARAVIKLE